MPTTDHSRVRQLTNGIIVGVLASLAAAALSGCYTSHETRARRDQPPAALPADAWPALDAAAVDPLRNATPEVIPAYALAPGADEGSLSPEDRERLGTPGYTVRHNRIAGRDPGFGLLRIYQEPARAMLDDPEQARIQRAFDQLLTGGFEFNASFVTAADVRAKARIAGAADQIISGIGGGTGAATTGPLRPSSLADEIALESGVLIELPPPASDGRPYRGTVLHFCTLIPNQYERALVTRLRADGWFVVCFNTKTRSTLPKDQAAESLLPGLMARIAELDQRRTEYFSALFTPGSDLPGPERTEQHKRDSAEFEALYSRIMKIRRGWFTLRSAEDVERVAAEVAAHVDTTLAENAYAAEAVLEYLAAERPDAPQNPLVVVGMSAGSLAAPAVATRLGERVGALVLVAGGADLVAISRATSLSGAAIQIRHDEQTPASPELLDALNAAYLRKTRLDPYVLAPGLARTPVLLVLAVGDTMVPISAGETLYERLGRPDRTTFRLGFAEPHHELFYFLPRHAREIVRWINSKSRDPVARVWSE